MPRAPREKSKTGIYHVILRGINKKAIFHDDEDNVRFLETLGRYKAKSGIRVYGWCLMGNHVHLLLGQGNEEISTTMKRVGISYAWFYNWKYNAVGHLFQDRYRSEKVEDDAYLLTVIRYIHQNPVKAGMVKNSYDWKWSSCRAYYGMTAEFSGLLDGGLILGILSEDRGEAIRQLRQYSEKENSDRCIDDVKKVRLSDKEAASEIRKLMAGYDAGCEITGIKHLPPEHKGQIFREIKKIEGLSLRQAARIMNVSHIQIYNA